MAKNKILIILVPLLAVLVAMTAYQYGYLEVQARAAALREEAAAKSKTLAKYMSLIGGKPALEKRLAALKEERKAEEAKLIEGQTLSITAASLQDTVKGIIAGRGGRIMSERTGKPETVGKFTLITASMDAELPDTRALADILYSLESRTPSLIVKELDVRVRDFQKPRELSVKLDVSALTGGRK